MKTLWLYPPAFPKEDPEGWQRRRFAKRARALAEALPAEGKVIFADPSVRSRAEWLAASMGTIVRPIQEQNGSFRILSDIPQRMEEDLYEKTGETIFFARPGAVLTETTDAQTRVLWQLAAADWIFLQYPAEPVAPFREDDTHSLKDLMEPAIQKAALRMRDNLTRFIAAPEEPEGVHQLRVSIRSFRALLSLVKPLAEAGEYARLQDHFRQLARKCARLRELDVLIEEWMETKETGDEALVVALQKERTEEMEQLLAYMDDPLTKQAFASGVNRFLRMLSDTPWEQLDGVRFIDKRLHAWYRFSLEGLWKMDGFDWPVAHKIRLKSKKYRYIAEHFRAYMTPLQLERHKTAKKRQTVLGLICDSLRNQEAVEELLPDFSSDTKEEAERFIEREKAREETLRAQVGEKEENNKKEETVMKTEPEEKEFTQEPEKEPEIPPQNPPKNIFATRWPMLILIVVGFLLVWYMSR